MKKVQTFFNGESLRPCSPAVARKLITQKKATAIRMEGAPFSIRLLDESALKEYVSSLRPIRKKIAVREGTVDG